MADDIQSNIRINIDTASAMDSIRLLQNQISAFHTQMSKMGAASVADSRNMQQNLINSINSTGAFAANMTKVKTTAEQFTSSLEKNKLSMGEYFRYAGGATKSFGKLFQAEFDTINKVARERVKDLQSQYIKLGRDANGAMQAIKVRPLTLDMDNLATKTQIAAQRQQLLNQLLKQGSTNLLNFGKNTQWAGRQLMVGFTIPLSIMGGAAMKAYKEIEEAGIRLKRVYGDLGTTNMETDKMVKEVQKLALEFTKYGIAVKDSMDMAATAAATGKKGADLLAQVASSARLAVLGGVDQQMALKTTISLTDAFGVSAKELGKNINFLNAVENQTVLSIEDMTTAIPKAAPVIQQLGGNVKDLAFFLTAMKEGGINASESANALKSGLASLINPTNTASKMLQGFGINLREIVQGNKGDVKKTVIDFAKALDTLDPLNRAKAIEQLFGKFQFARMSTLFKNVIEQGSQASEVLKLASASSLELSMLAQRELSKIESSPLYKFQKSIADFQAQLAPVGEQFMKALTPVINFGTDILKNFNNLGDGVKGFIVKFVAVAGVVGPVLLMSFGLIANAVANVIKGFALMKDIFNKTGKSSLSLGEQVNYMTNEQIQAAAIASSLDQVHSKLKQTFTSEAAAVDMLTAAYERSVIAQRGFAVPVAPRGPVGKGPVRKYAAGGIISGPGTGTSDSILAMVSNGEAIIPAASVARNPGMVKQLVSGNIPRFADGLVPAYTNAVALLSGETNQALKTGVSGKSLASEIRQIGPGMNAPIVEAIAKSLGAKNNNQVIGMLRNNPDLLSFARSIQVGVAQEMDAIGSRKIQDPELSKIYQTVARREAAARGQLFATETEKFLTTPTTFEDTTTTRQRSNGRIMSIGRATLFSGLASYRSKNYKPIAQELGTDPTGLVKSHMSDRIFLSLKEATTKFGLELSNQAKSAADRMANGIVRVSQSIRPRMQQAEAVVAQSMAEAGQMRSPSRVTKQKGAQLVQGAVQGIQEGVDDVRRAGSQLGQAAAQGVSQSGRVAGQGSRRSSSEGQLVFIPGQGYVSEGQLARDTALANAPVYGPREGTKAEKLGFTTAGRGGKISNLFSNIGNTAGNSIKNMSQGKFQGGMFGASLIAGLGSMVGGPVGEVSGALSMPLAIAGIFPKLQGILGGIVGGLTRFIPVIGTALAAWQLWDQVAVPLIRKNADAYDAITETLGLTQTKIEGLNKFFGTDVKLTGIRAMKIASGSQSENQASIAKQLQESQDFKDIYQQSAQKMQGLSDKDFKSSIEFMAVDLFGQGYEAEAVTAIVDAIALEAKKSRVSIAPELFSLDNAETRALMEKNIQKVFSDVSEISKRNANVGIMSPEDSSKIKASQTQIASYMSSLSGQLANGAITGQQFNIQYEKLISLSEKSFGTSGIDSLRLAFIQLNAEIGNTMERLDKTQFGIVSKAITAGVTPTIESGKVFDFGTDSQIRSQVKLYGDALKQQLALDSKVNKTKAQLKAVQGSTQNISNLEGKINDKYDKRIKQLEKIKKLNDQMKQSQQGQLTLAEALNKGDIGAAARAAIDIQNNDIQTSLSNQQEGLDAARKAEIDPLKNAQANNTAAVDSLTKKIEDLIAEGVTVKNLPPRELDSVMTPEERLKKQGIPEWLMPMYLFFNPGARKASPDSSGGKGIAKGGHITGPGSGTSDSIPAMLSNGEYVIRANAVKKIGVNALDKLNQADRLGYAGGGMIRHFKGGGYNGYADGGLVENLFGNTQNWFNNVISSMFGSGGNPTTALNATASDMIKTGAKNTIQGYKDFVFDPTDPVDYGLAALPGLKPAKTIAKKASDALGFSLVLKPKVKTPGLAKFTPASSLGITPGGMKKIDGEDYYVKKPSGPPDLLGELMGSTLWNKLGLGGPKLQMLSPSLVASKIIPNLTDSTAINMSKFIDSAPNKVDGANKLLFGLKDYVKNQLPVSGLMGNIDTHSGNIMLDNKTGKLHNIDLGITNLTSYAGASAKNLMGEDLARRMKYLVQAMKDSGFNSRQINDLLKKNGFSAIDDETINNPYGPKGFFSSYFQKTRTKEKNFSKEINSISKMMGFDLSKPVTSKANAAAINARDNRFIQDMIKQNPELEEWLGISDAKTTKRGLNLNGLHNWTVSHNLEQTFLHLQNAAKDPIFKYANGGLVGYKDGGKVKPPKPTLPKPVTKKSNLSVNPITAKPVTQEELLSMKATDPKAPWNKGGWATNGNDPNQRKAYWQQYGWKPSYMKEGDPTSGEVMDVAKNMAYFTPVIGAMTTAGDAATSFGKGDVGGGILNSAFAAGSFWMPKAISMVGKGLGAAGKFIKTGLGIRGGSNALKAAASSTKANVSKVGKLTPRIGFNLSDAALHSMVKDNFYGNMRVPGIRSSTKDSMMNRIAVEKNMMGIPANAPASKTPAYGFLTTKEDVPSYFNSISGGMGPRSASQQAIDDFNLLVNPMSRYLSTYGSNTIKLKPSALGKSTISMGDSLSIWDKAIGLGKKIPTVNKLSSIFSTFPALSGKLEATQNMMAKNVPGKTNATRFPYIEAHLPGGFTVKDIESIMLNPTGRFGPHATEKIAADLAERKAALEVLFESMGIKGVKITENGGIKIGKETLGGNYPLPTRGPKKLIKNPFARMPEKIYESAINNVAKIKNSIKTNTTLMNAKKVAKPFVKPFRDIKTLLLAKQYARNIGEVPHISDLDIFNVQKQYSMFMKKMNLGKDNRIGSMGAETHPERIADELGISENSLDNDIFAYISGVIANKKSEAGYFNGVIRKNEPRTVSYLNNYAKETTYSADDIYLSLNEKFRGKGIAQKFTTQYMELLKKAGINKINIDAGLTDGGYAWARAGFKFSERPKSLIERMEMAVGTVDDPKFLNLLDRLNNAPVKDLPLPKEILGLKTNWRKYLSEDQIKEAAKAMSDRNGVVSGSKYKVNLNTKSLGELFLRGSSWKGYKDLTKPLKSKKYAMGGFVMPSLEPAPRQFANGGYAMGTDTVPAMLTPGEFVIKKSAVDRIGSGTLNKINGYANGGLVGGSTSTAIGDSVYNYSVNVNVATDSDPNQIARAVMSQIRKVDNHRVRGSSI